jgi:tetraacyldisaccharide 4'-kinase
MNLPLPIRILLWPLSWMYGVVVRGRAFCYSRGIFRGKRLGAPVISVGNLTVGGTGKTPMVLWLAERFLAQGKRVAILSRGYRGSRGTNDEIELMKRRLGDSVAFGVGPDRYLEGKRIEARQPVDVFLLDDGFQHLALYRDLDVVLLDVTQRSSEFALLPAGRMREPFSALQRAHWVILTRTELGDATGLQARVQGINPRARIFRWSTKFAGLIEARDGLSLPHDNLLPKKVAAFCGIGNSAAFFADLRSWGFNVAAERAYPDHHVYSSQELDTICALSRSARAEAILTTEKDCMNLPPNWYAPMPLFACCISTEIEEKMEFDRALLAAVQAATERRTT